ncbi:alcohol dehydrogenase catalytic domain-containing protein [Auritidibacter ignavus]|uniref:Alcohol dehydrogenase catalytic domain-containing protein n=1 Tax=Auritidibacter ignavus TaxID=678932 RepID=A0AAJ6DDD9_9MICC|nr:alcohol dehydrogenase catalytic domain-containing protein [Auritidibacter ignavus]PXA79116.1 glutathione-dependent formaldehyde dehydrogenase [Auritidibacter sp. NML120779]WGH82149.1 alcohol dehydrogenase catalytic domain-containing protein [Auritidibacter ignavus]WGH84409.1 alcohol dehydrogenase catalytic domain-containing protein [Auritidibacter ignavus]WGH93732.1 alcohol dehydrogenase catalytic domain-containing protein [Auritidibacter ignavus]WHS27909.1 alcohol dehydrogenase catalytic d
MKAVTWQGPRKVSVETVPDPVLEKPKDAVVEITSTAICGSDLHLYEVLGPFMTPGDIIGHEPMGRVVEAGSETNLRVGDRVVIPFQIACGDCFFCNQGLQTQCETTQVTEQGSGARLFGYSQIYGAVPGGQAQYLRVPHADYGPIVVGEELPDHRYLFLSDVLPTAWQAVAYAQRSAGESVAVIGLGPIGQFAARIAKHQGLTVYAIEPEAERREMAARHGVLVFDTGDDSVAAIRDATQGRGPDAVIDAVGMEAHGDTQSMLGKLAQRSAQFLPEKLSQPMMENFGMDRLAALYTAIDLVRRGGTISLSGVYGGQASPLPMLTLFDKQIQVTMGQANVRNWIDQILPLVEDPADPLGVDDFVTHRLPLHEAPGAYEMFQKKEDGCIKVVLDPQATA